VPVINDSDSETRTRGPCVREEFKLDARCGGGKRTGLGADILFMKFLPMLRSCPSPSNTTSWRVLMYTPTQKENRQATKMRMLCFSAMTERCCAAAGREGRGKAGWRDVVSGKIGLIMNEKEIE
jgi:hypothetical protein